MILLLKWSKCLLQIFVLLNAGTYCRLSTCFAYRRVEKAAGPQLVLQWADPAHSIKPRFIQKCKQSMSQCRFYGFRRVPRRLLNKCQQFQNRPFRRTLGKLSNNCQNIPNRPFRRTLGKLSNKNVLGRLKIVKKCRNIVPRTTF